MKTLLGFFTSLLDVTGVGIKVLAVSILAFSTVPGMANEFPGKNHAEKTIRYKNSMYGFSFTLPGSWKGYSILVEKWDGVVINGSGEAIGKVAGPLIRIRHPHWTQANPWQDIPIMVFTIDQWNDESTVVVSAAPFGPGEIGRNAKYVFALPARYNSADAIGVNEVDAIIQSNPLHPI